MAEPRKICRINGVALDVVVSESLSLSSDVTSYPVEDGGDISDHVHNQPDSISIEAIVNAIPLNLEAERGDDPVAQVRAALEEIRSQRQTFTYEGLRGIYKDMVFTSLSFPFDPNTGDALRFSASMQRVNKRELVRVAARYRPAGTMKPPGPGLWLCPPLQGIAFGIGKRLAIVAKAASPVTGKEIKPQSSEAINRGLGCRKVVKRGSDYYFVDNGKKLNASERERMRAQNDLPQAMIKGHGKPIHDANTPVAAAPGAGAVKVMSTPAKPFDVASTSPVASKLSKLGLIRSR